MIKNITSLVLSAACLHSFALHADNATAQDSYIETDSKWTLSIKSGAFLPSSSEVRRLYGSAMPEITIEGSLKVWEGEGDFYLWLDGSYIFANGHSYGYSKSPTRVNLVPITLGAKYAYPFSSSTSFYLGAGPAYSFVDFCDQSPYVHQKTSGKHLGAIAKSGVIHNLLEGLSIEGFFNYSYQPFSCFKNNGSPDVERRSVNFNGLHLGLGLNWKF